MELFLESKAALFLPSHLCFFLVPSEIFLVLGNPFNSSISKTRKGTFPPSFLKKAFVLLAIPELQVLSVVFVVVKTQALDFKLTPAAESF